MKKIGFFVLICISVLAGAQDKMIREKDFIALINSQGASKAIEYYREFRKNYPDSILFNRKTINNLGWETASEGDIEEAIKLFELNILAYPGHYDPWDSYGEAVLICGGIDYIEIAIKNFEKSLELDPENTNASQRLLVLKNYTEYIIPGMLNHI